MGKLLIFLCSPLVVIVDSSGTTQVAALLIGYPSGREKLDGTS
jgi:hypothetical protein